MASQKLHYVWEYTDRDRAFWEEHLEDFVPRRILDAHTHVTDPALRLDPMTDAKRKQYWVNEVLEPIEAPTAERCMKTVFPGREVTCVAMGHPSVEYDIDAANVYTSRECSRRGWYGLALLRPQWDAERVAAELDRPGVIGVKPYYQMIGPSPDTRDKYIEASIFEFLPQAALEVLADRRAWVTLHVPKADRLGHPDNIREVREIRRCYPNVVLVIAHLGRSYTLPHAEEALPPLADDEGLYFDISAVMNPDVLRLALGVIGPGRLLYGTDNPVFYMRGRRTWDGRTYTNHTSADFHFNRGRHEPPQVEAGYTLMMYEALRALRVVCEDLALSSSDMEAIFCGNAKRLISGVVARKSR